MPTSSMLMSSGKIDEDVDEDVSVSDGASGEGVSLVDVGVGVSGSVPVWHAVVISRVAAPIEKREALGTCMLL